MNNLNNMCMFEGRTTQNQKYSQFNGTNGPVDKVFFSVSVPRVLSSQQRQDVKAGNTTIKQNDFVNFSLIGAQVKTLQTYFPAGTPIKVFARYTEYEKTNATSGQKEYGHVFEVENISFVSTPSQNLQNGGNSGGGNTSYSQSTTPTKGNASTPTSYQQPVASATAQQDGNFQMFSNDAFPF